MTEYYGDVVVQASAFSARYKGVDMSLVEGSGHLRSNDLEVARNLSNGLTETVDHAITYAYKINKAR